MSKSARRCGAKHIWKSKCSKHTILRPLLEVEMSKKRASLWCEAHLQVKRLKTLHPEMSKKCTSLWREAHFQVKMYKTHRVRTTFRSWSVEKVHAVVARSTFQSQHVKNTTCSDHFWDCAPCQKWAKREGFVACPQSKPARPAMLGATMCRAKPELCVTWFTLLKHVSVFFFTVMHHALAYL